MRGSSFFSCTTAALLALAALGGCGAKVTSDDGGTGGAGGSGSGPTGGSSESVGTSAVSSTAVSSSAASTASSTASSGAGGGGGAGGASPGAIVLEDGTTTVMRFASFGPRCADPDDPPPFGECSWWELEVTFPASYLVVGEVPVDDPNVKLFMQSSGEPNSPDPQDCPGNGAVGGGAGIGSISIASITADAVTVTLLGLSGFVDGDVDGTYEAVRCTPGG